MLKGKQKKLDVNKDGKISGDDFAMLKNVRMQKKDAMGKKVVKAESGKMIADSAIQGAIGAAAAESTDRISEVDTAMAERAAGRRPLPMLEEYKRKPITPKERREKDIAKRAQKKMGGGMMMQDSMGYKRGGSVLVKTKLGRTKPTKMF